MAKLRWTKGKQAGVHGGNKDQREKDQAVEGRGVVYDIGNKTFDFRNMRASDLPFNKRVHLPEPHDEESEIAIQNLKVKLNQITAEYVDGERLGKWSNLEEEEKSGLMSLKRKVQVRQNVVFRTDKSGRFSAE